MTIAMMLQLIAVNAAVLLIGFAIGADLKKILEENKRDKELEALEDMRRRNNMETLEFWKTWRVKNETDTE
ncbi:MAG: hypothetical protein IJS61_03390 [Firmicutes bacterium]|nr:hypothetical protein [Bacillota bacterium]